MLRRVVNVDQVSMASFIDYLNAQQLGVLAGEVVLAVGMTPEVKVMVPNPVAGCSWRRCYKRGLERLARPENLS